ncbi:MAG TPA: methyltransferase domain-containing protein [Rhodanobacteraceae bacterium]|nr:methyltransferase domain-containing protein [Rhodanobacteraceae bacterium]
MTASLTVRAALVACSLGFTASALAALAPDFVDKLESEQRPLEDRVRDGARRPYQVMQLLGVDAGQTLLDVGAGGGWFTRVLSAATGPSGKVIAQFGPRALQRENGQGPKDLAASLGNTEAYFGNVSELPANSVDAAITALNMHHMNAERAGPYLKEILAVLKPGGRAAIIDHVGVPTANNAMLHRMLPSDVKTWIQQAGFEIVSEPDILRTTADDHTLSVDDPRLGRDVDQFMFIVRKPQR